MFSIEKTTQASAFLLNKHGGRMSVLKLMKLLYISDRESMKLYGYTLTGDKHVSMPYGPVLSRTLNFISMGLDAYWKEWISDRSDHHVSLNKKELQNVDLYALSKSNIQLLESIYSNFASYNRFDLANYTHDNFSEWVDPDGSSLPITRESVFLALGNDEKTAKALAEREQEISDLDELIASMA